MSLKRLLFSCAIVMLAFTLVSCETNSSEEVVNTPTATPVLPTTTSLPAETPSSTPPPSFPLDRYIVIFNKDGDLYFQDENNIPIQLTHGGEKPHYPILSDDNKKVVFTRGETSVISKAYSNIYSVNSDGSDERALITPEWLATFGEGEGARFLSFLPGTHQLRFKVCELQEFKSPCSTNFFLLDVDSGEIEESSHNYFNPSPDGKMAVDISSAYINIVDVSGKVIRQNILPYKATAPVEIFPDIQWLPDSSGLIVAIPVSTELSVYEGNLTYTVWRYTINTDTVIQIPLDPIPAKTFAQCAEVISESPDGNWGLYNSAEAGLYLWKLGSDVTKLYDAKAYCSQPLWSSDNKRFFYGGSGESYSLGSVDQPPVRLHRIESPSWIDSDHFIYTDTTDLNAPKLRIGQIVGETILTYDHGSYILIKPKY